MNHYIYILLFVFTVLTSLFTCSNAPHQSLISLAVHCDSTPELNKRIIDFVNANMKKKVGKGECWDLAAQALNKTTAIWDKRYQFGAEVNYKTDCVYPGDIIQLEGVVLKYKQGNADVVEKMLHHTAVIYEVKGVGDFILAHQNTAFTGKKVGVSAIKIEQIAKGRFKIYRPVAKK